MAINGLPSQLSQGQFNNFLGSNASNILQQNPALQAQFGAYQNAYSALQPAENAALGAYNTQSQNVANQALGGLNARGLGRSLQGNAMAGQPSPVSGYGSGALSNLASQRLQGANSLAQGYTQQANNLNMGLTGTAYNANNTFNQLNLQQQALQRAQNASDPLNPANLFGDVTKGASILALL